MPIGRQHRDRGCEAVEVVLSSDRADLSGDPPEPVQRDATSGTRAFRRTLARRPPRSRDGWAPGCLPSGESGGGGPRFLSLSCGVQDAWNPLESTHPEARVVSEPLLGVRDLAKHFVLPRRRLFGRAELLRALDGVSFDLPAGETLGVVGESGCGKTTMARLVLRLLEPTRGGVSLEGVDLLGCSKEELRRLRRQMQIVFQDPLSSLNPRMTVGVSVTEPMRFHAIGTRIERLERARELLEVVGMGPEVLGRYPHEFSGGQCQRISIARALILRPKLVVLDEPVSALDISIRAQILKLLLDLQDRFSLTYLFISHDLSVVKRFCRRTAVLYLGKLVELCESERLYREPLHPYTRALIDAIPSLDPKAGSSEGLRGLEGDVPSAVDPPSGCRFHTRCPHRMPVCSEREPPLVDVGAGRKVACFLNQ